MTTATIRSVDVAVLGGGLAGMATALHVARSGRSVVCVEPRIWPRDAVGESLEFSAPRLLDELGIDRACDRAVTHPKSGVRIVEAENEFTVWPPPFFGRAPIWCSRHALHTDRRELDRRVMELALHEGVDVITARVSRVDHQRDTITGVALDDGTRLEGSWYVDATGHHARVLGRALRLDRHLYGERRYAFWTRVAARDPGEETTLSFCDPNAPELCWRWAIPLNEHQVSIGVVLGEAARRRHHRRGHGPRQILEHHTDPIAWLADTEPDAPLDVHATSYVPFRHRRPIGPNWMLVGDAAAMVDPLTSNGVTSALRHASLAADVIGRAGSRRRLPRGDAVRYRSTAPALVGALNVAIESFLYDPRLRRRVGLRAAVNLYAATGVITNALYAKLGHTTRARAWAAAAVPLLAGVWTRVARTAARVPGSRRDRPASRRASTSPDHGGRHRA